MADENGNMTQEEIDAMQQKITELEEKAEKVDELANSLKEKEEELSKLSKKDFNFQRLREKSDTEIEEMKKKMSEKEKMLLTEVMELTRERQEEKEIAHKEYVREIINNLSKGDKELAKKIEAQEKNLIGEGRTPAEIEERYRKAYIMEMAEMPRANPIFSGYSPSYSDPNVDAKRFTDTDTGKDSVTKWFPSLAPKIYKK